MIAFSFLMIFVYSEPGGAANAGGGHLGGVDPNVDPELAEVGAPPYLLQASILHTPF